MLLGQLPPLEETQSGKDLIEIGRQQGLEQGLKLGLKSGLEQGLKQGLKWGLEQGFEEAILVFLTAQHGTLPTDLAARIRALPIDEAKRLLAHLPGSRTLDGVAQWLAEG